MLDDKCSCCSRRGFGRTMFVIRLNDWRCREHLPDDFKDLRRQTS